MNHASLLGLSSIPAVYKKVEQSKWKVSIYCTTSGDGDTRIKIHIAQALVFLVSEQVILMENNLSLIFIIAVTFLTTKAQGLFNPSATLISDDSPSLLSSRKPVRMSIIISYLGVIVRSSIVKSH